MIASFYENKQIDEELLVKIIDLLRKVPAPKEDHPIVTRVCKYIEEHLAEDLLVSQIAEKLNVSIYYLSHVFKTLTGATVIEYRNELRLTKSKQLLLHTDMRIGEIALEVGFSNVAYFSEIFSRSEKISPSQYRNLHQTQAE